MSFPVSLRNTVTVMDARNYVQAMSSPAKLLISQVLTLLLVIPATNVTLERSFIVIRKIKTYLSSTISLDRLNLLILLHSHKDLTDSH